MEKKNTILLTVIAIATLLVAVVGATFAYFTAQVTTENNDQNSTNVKAATLASATMDFGKSVTANDVYPGAMVVKSVNVTGTCGGNGNTTCTPIEANISVTPNANVATYFTTKETDNNGQTSDITWSLYRSDKPIVCRNPKQTSTGTPEENGNSTTTTNQYEMLGSCKIADQTLADAIKDMSEEEIAERVNAIAEVTWNAYQDVSTLDSTVLTATSTGNGRLITGATASETAKISIDGSTNDNYYLVVSYRNLGNQNDQQGKDFKIDLGFTAEDITNS